MARLNTPISKDGSVFWSYPAHLPNVNHDQDPNFLAAADFCDMHNILYDVNLFKTLRHLPEYRGFSFNAPDKDVPNIRADASEISKEFAKLASGSHVTVAVDYSRANSFFRKNELPEILSSKNITHVRRIQLIDDGYILAYQNIDEWLEEQLHQWWGAAFKIDPLFAIGETNRLAALISADRTTRCDGERSDQRLQVYMNFGSYADPDKKHAKLQKALGKISRHKTKDVIYAFNNYKELS